MAEPATSYTLCPSRRRRTSGSSIPSLGGSRSQECCSSAVALWPIAQGVWFSLLDYNLTRPARARFVGLENYAHVLTDTYFWRSLRNTLVIVLVVVHVELLLGLGLALLFTSGLPAKRLLLAAILAPMQVQMHNIQQLVIIQ